MKRKIDKNTLTSALQSAIEDVARNGTATPSNPAIVVDADGNVTYGSSLTNTEGDFILFDLQEGVGVFAISADQISEAGAVAQQWSDEMYDDLCWELNDI